MLVFRTKADHSRPRPTELDWYQDCESRVWIQRHDANLDTRRVHDKERTLHFRLRDRRPFSSHKSGGPVLGLFQIASPSPHFLLEWVSREYSNMTCSARAHGTFRRCDPIFPTPRRSAPPALKQRILSSRKLRYLDTGSVSGLRRHAGPQAHLYYYWIWVSPHPSVDSLFNYVPSREDLYLEGSTKCYATVLVQFPPTTSP